MKKSDVSKAILFVFLSVILCGCSNSSETAPASMGPMPTSPPPGNPQVAAAQSGVSPDEFVNKLQGLSKSDRAAYMKRNQAVMNSILGSPQASPAKQKLMAIISEH